MTTFDSSVATEQAPSLSRVWRVEVHPLDAADDPSGRSVLHEAQELRLAPGMSQVRTARIYLIQAGLDEAAAHRIAGELLADPINQRYVLGPSEQPADAAVIEVHYLPGVMDPVAQSTEDAIREMLPDVESVEVRTGFRYELVGASDDDAQTLARRLLCNAVVQSYHTAAVHPERFVQLQPYQFRLTHVVIRELDDAALMKMSREAHLFLSLAEMKAIQDYYRSIDREPTDIELETLAQTWSEHCVHKTLKATVSYREGPGESGGMAMPPLSAFADRPGHELLPDGTLVIRNLLKSTIAAATRKLIDDGTVDWCVSVFVDNAGVIRFDDTDSVTFKVETHNRPSAIEPYGGAATGIGGCIRDTMGTGMSARPIANTDVFCVAFAEHWEQGTEGPRDQATKQTPDSPHPRVPGFLGPSVLPRGVLHPRRVLKQVVAGVRDYGNRMGIPTVNGLVYFDDRYLGNPLVFAGSVGIIPTSMAFKKTQPGDRIIAMGGRTGRDGIHGATFSSAELTDTHADEFAHAVQIGNAITEKKVLDVILQARDHEGGPLFNAITDCGAGGFSSAVGEMGAELGAYVQLEKAPLKYAGLSYTEIWISEAQERMVLAVPPEKVQALVDLCAREDVEVCDLGHFGTDNAELILTYAGQEVGRMSMHFLHEGIPQPTREATWRSDGATKRPSDAGTSLASPASPSPLRRSVASSLEVADTLLALLAHPNIASKHWIIRQYDHEVQGGSAVKPLVGRHEDGPSDASVIRPKLDSHRGVALSCGLQTALGDFDPYWMTLASIDEAVRNAVCVGADPNRIAILDNFCWAKCDIPENLGSLVRAAEACYDGALAYRTPFISGKDSLNNQFTREDGSVIAIPPTLLISAIGIVEDARKCVTMDAKTPGNLLIQIGVTTNQLAGSHLSMLTDVAGGEYPRVDLEKAPRQLATVAKLIQQGHVRSAHDCSEGGMLVAAAEMAFAGRLGLELHLAGVPRTGDPRNGNLPTVAACFAENPSRILLEVEPRHFDDVARALRAANVPFGHIGTFNRTDRLTVLDDHRQRIADLSIEQMLQTWKHPLDW